MKLLNWLHLTCTWIIRNKFYVGLLALVAVLSAVVWGWEWLQWMWWSCWSWLGAVSEFQESRSTTLRNIGLLVGGGIAIWVAYRRSVIAQRGLLNERYQKGAEMLGSKVMSVRLGGIYALHRLGEEEPEKYHVQVMELFCAFVTEPFREKDEMDDKERDGAGPMDEKLRQRKIRNLVMALLVPKDVQAVLTAFRDRSDSDIKLEKKASFVPNLSHAELRGANLSEVNLSGADLSYAVFAPPNKTHIQEEVVDTLKMPIVTTNLSGADLRGANLFEADLEEANLTGADLRGAVNLSYDQLHSALAASDNPPKLDDDPVWDGGEPIEVPAIMLLREWVSKALPRPK